MTVQISQIQSQEPRLFQDSYNQTDPDHSFRQYLEEEQKRLAFMFSPFGQFNFNSWFEYPDFTLKADSLNNNANLFSNIELTSAETFGQNPQPNTQKEIPASNQASDQSINYYFAKPAQFALQDLLMKTGWLTPNLEALSQFYLAQLEGKLLSKLDLQFLIDQILSQVRLVKEKGKVELILGLKPENLGEILLTLTSRSGMVSIQIQAPEETKKLIEAELKELELALKKAKVNLAEIKIITKKEVDQHA